MARIRFDFGALTLDAELLDTPTAKAIAAALPIASSVLTWGEEVYFDVPVEVEARDAMRARWSRRARSPTGRKARPSRSASAARRSPRATRRRLASPCNVFAKALGNVKVLGQGEDREQGRGQSRYVMRSMRRVPHA